jgi:poly(ADP-ribose) glycohydrolase ARH3
MARTAEAPAGELRERFRGCLLGLAVGDALGGRFEAQSSEAIRARVPTVEDLLAYPQDELWYTDDTQMAIGVAEALRDHGRIVEEQLCAAFVANYVPSRGYGWGARAVLEAMEEGRDYRAVAERHFPGGSYGNGAAMRVAPVGLFCGDDAQLLGEQARLSALPTHLHPLGIEGAQLLALGVGLCSRVAQFDRDDFFARLLAACTSAEFRGKLEQAAAVRGPEELAGLGNGIAALESVPTALASFALTPGSYGETVANVIFLGGDTDTLAAMAGALSGAYLGLGGVPERLVGLLEESPKGRRYLAELADGLFDRYARVGR